MRQVSIGVILVLIDDQHLVCLALLHRLVVLDVHDLLMKFFERVAVTAESFIRELLTTLLSVVQILLTLVVE